MKAAVNGAQNITKEQEEVIKMTEKWKNNVMDYIGSSVVQREDVKKVVFEGTCEKMNENCKDLSVARDRSVLARAEEENDGITLYIGAEGGVNGKVACEEMFMGFTGLERVEFNGNLHTDEAESMRLMFARCYKLKAVDMRDFITIRVKDADFMFRDCCELERIYMRTWAASFVSARGIFKNCESLREVYLSGLDFGLPEREIHFIPVMEDYRV